MTELWIALEMEYCYQMDDDRKQREAWYGQAISRGRWAYEWICLGFQIY